MLRGRGRASETSDRRQAVIEHDHAGGEGGLHRRPLGRTAAAQEAAAEFHVPLVGRKGSRKAGEEKTGRRCGP